MRLNINRWLLALLICFSTGAITKALAHDPVADVQENDVEMEAAIKKARDSLPQFWAKFQKPSPNEESFSLKAAILYDADSAEHIWVTRLQRKNGKVRAIIDNAPKYLKHIQLGQHVEFDENQISDWMYLRDGKIVGNFTIRPLLSRIPAAQAERYRAMLAEP